MNMRVNFQPRRLGHANLYVGDLAKAVEFYNIVCGLELVRREEEIAAAFLTNGNTHHDLGLMQAKVVPETWVDLKGRQRHRAARDMPVGLNHLGWEMDNEQQLVDAWRRAKTTGVALGRTLDHQISRSVYLPDPDGNFHEFYADAMDDWRKVFNLEEDDVVTKPWDPEAVEPDSTPHWIENPDLRDVPDAHFHAQFITHAGIVAKDYNAMKRFFIDVGGLTLSEEAEDGKVCLLRGPAASVDLVLFHEDLGLKAGLAFLAFVVSGEEALRSSHERAKQAGIHVISSVDEPGRRSVTLRDPDGVNVVLYTGSSGNLGLEAGREVIDGIRS
ncbi:MAG: VOC family protein [Rhizobiaceae bacterium]|nr:VOC family protein [Rhizobiaceae bacterium]